MRTAKLLPALLLLCASAGCALHRAPVVPPAGLLFTKYRAPLTTEFHDTPAAGSVGVATASYVYVPFFGLDFAWDEAAVQEAAREGGISKIHYADYEAFLILGIYGTFTTRVYGE